MKAGLRDERRTLLQQRPFLVEGRRTCARKLFFLCFFYLRPCMTAVYFWSPTCLDTPCRPHCLPASVTVAYLAIAIGGCFFFLKHRRFITFCGARVFQEYSRRNLRNFRSHESMRVRDCPSSRIRYRRRGPSVCASKGPDLVLRRLDYVV